LTVTCLSPLVCDEVKNAGERTLVPDVFDPAAGRVDRSEAEIALTSSETCRVHTSVHAARGSADAGVRASPWCGSTTSVGQWSNGTKNLHLGKPVAAARAAEEDRELVADQLAATGGEDRRAVGETCPVVLAPVGGGPSDAPGVCGDSVADLGAATSHEHWFSFRRRAAQGLKALPVPHRNFPAGIPSPRGGVLEARSCSASALSNAPLWKSRLRYDGPDWRIGFMPLYRGDSSELTVS